MLKAAPCGSTAYAQARYEKLLGLIQKALLTMGSIHAVKRRMPSYTASYAISHLLYVIYDNTKIALDVDFV